MYAAFRWYFQILLISCLPDRNACRAENTMQKYIRFLTSALPPSCFPFPPSNILNILFVVCCTVSHFNVRCGFKTRIIHSKIHPEWAMKKDPRKKASAITGIYNIVHLTALFNPFLRASRWIILPWSLCRNTTMSTCFGICKVCGYVVSSFYLCNFFFMFNNKTTDLTSSQPWPHIWAGFSCEEKKKKNTTHVSTNTSICGEFHCLCMHVGLKHLWHFLCLILERSAGERIFKMLHLKFAVQRLYIMKRYLIDVRRLWNYMYTEYWLW